MEVSEAPRSSSLLSQIEAVSRIHSVDSRGFKKRKRGEGGKECIVYVFQILASGSCPSSWFIERRLSHFEKFSKRLNGRCSITLPRKAAFKFSSTNKHKHRIERRCEALSNVTADLFEEVLKECAVLISHANRIRTMRTAGGDDPLSSLFEPTVRKSIAVSCCIECACVL